MKSLKAFTVSAFGRPAAWLGLLFTAVLLLPLLTGCVSTSQKENWLVQSGFKPISADTPERANSLKELPKGKITPVTRNGQTYYVFPSPKENALYVGSPGAYSTYKQLVASKSAAVEDQDILYINQAGPNPWVNLPNYWDTWGTWLMQ